MKNRKSPAPLREQIVAFLKGREEATLKQIAAATSERDFPSRVTTELNKMRTDTLIECAKKKGKNELWYWLATAQADQSGNTQPAVVENTGSSASALPSTPVEGAAVQPKPAPVAAALSAALVAEDEIMSDGTRVLLNNLETQIAKVRSVIRDGARIRLCDVGDTVLARISHLEAALGDMRNRAELAENQRDSYLAARDELRRELDEVRATLAPHAGGSLAMSDISEAELAKRASALIVAKENGRIEAIRLLDESRLEQVEASRQLDEVRIVLAGAISPLDYDLDSMNAVEMARAARTELLDAPPTVTPFDSNAPLSAEAEDRVTATLETRPANRFLVRANGRPLVVRRSEVSAQRQAMQYARSGVRATVFAMERIGEARPGAEWEPAQ